MLLMAPPPLGAEIAGRDGVDCEALPVDSEACPFPSFFGLSMIATAGLVYTEIASESINCNLLRLSVVELFGVCSSQVIGRYGRLGRLQQDRTELVAVQPARINPTATGYFG
jgi:hypothetical protein